MAATSAPQQAKAEASALQAQALRHLWMHFTQMGSFGPEHEVPIIVRGEGCYVWDDHGNRYLDGLSALFCVNSGHGRSELGDAMAAQVSELDFITVWSYAHPRAIELATRIASLTPGDLNRVFFTNSGSEAVESALKLARAYHRARGNGQKTKLIAREIAYHGTTLGALSATGIPALRSVFEPLVPGGIHVPNTNSYRWPPDRDPLWAANAIEERIEFEGPETVAAVILEPLQNAGGYQPDIITIAKALTSAYVPMGGMIASDEVFEPFAEGKAMFAHGSTFAGHPVAAATAMANLDVFEREDLCGHVLAKEGEFRAALESLYDIPIVGDVRGDGYFMAIELVKDQDTKETFDQEESEALLRGYLSGELYRRGLICRADDRGDPVVQFSPPLIADTEQFEEIVDVLRPVLEEAARRVGHRPGPKAARVR